MQADKYSFLNNWGKIACFGVSKVNPTSSNNHKMITITITIFKISCSIQFVWYITLVKGILASVTLINFKICRISIFILQYNVNNYKTVYKGAAPKFLLLIQSNSEHQKKASLVLSCSVYILWARNPEHLNSLTLLTF